LADWKSLSDGSVMNLHAGQLFNPTSQQLLVATIVQHCLGTVQDKAEEMTAARGGWDRHLLYMGTHGR